MNVTQYLELTVYDLLPEFDSYMAEVMANLEQQRQDDPTMEMPAEALVAVDVLNDFGHVPGDAKLFGDYSGLVARLVKKHYGG